MAPCARGANWRQEEMNALLKTWNAPIMPVSAIMARPTYIRLELKDIEKLFKRR